MSMLHEGDCLVRLDSIFVKRGEGGNSTLGGVCSYRHVAAVD